MSGCVTHADRLVALPSRSDSLQLPKHLLHHHATPGPHHSIGANNAFSFGPAHLPLPHAQGNYRNGGVFWIVYSISFWLLFSYMIPISLFVTMEIVKAFQVCPPRVLPRRGVLGPGQGLRLGHIMIPVLQSVTMEIVEAFQVRRSRPPAAFGPS